MLSASGPGPIGGGKGGWGNLAEKSEGEEPYII